MHMYTDETQVRLELDRAQDDADLAQRELSKIEAVDEGSEKPRCYICTLELATVTIGGKAHLICPFHSSRGVPRGTS